VKPGKREEREGGHKKKLHLKSPEWRELSADRDMSDNVIAL